MYNILVVDDDKEIVNAIEIYLKKEGYKIIKAYDGEMAIEESKKNEFSNQVQKNIRNRVERF